jgi:hypothetical protein
MNHHIPACEQALVPSDTLSDAALEEVATHRTSKSLADRNAKATVTELIGAVEDL